MKKSVKLMCSWIGVSGHEVEVGGIGVGMNLVQLESAEMELLNFPD
jgi:hypothetical protein